MSWKPNNAMGQLLVLILDAGNGSKVPRLWMEHFPAHLNLHFVSWDCPAKFHETHFGNPMESPMIFRKDSSRETAPKNDEVTTC